LRDGLGHEAAHVAHGRDVVGTVLVVVHAHGQQRPRCRAPQRPHVGRFLALPQHGLAVADVAGHVGQRHEHGVVRPMPRVHAPQQRQRVGGPPLRRQLRRQLAQQRHGQRQPRVVCDGVVVGDLREDGEQLGQEGCG